MPCIAGQTPRSLAAFANLKQLGESHLAGKYRIEVDQEDGGMAEVTVHDLGTGLVDAAAVAGLVLTTEAAIAEKPEKKHGAHPSAMPDYDMSRYGGDAHRHRPPSQHPRELISSHGDLR